MIDTEIKTETEISNFIKVDVQLWLGDNSSNFGRNLYPQTPNIYKWGQAGRQQQGRVYQLACFKLIWYFVSFCQNINLGINQKCLCPSHHESNFLHLHFLPPILALQAVPQDWTPLVKDLVPWSLPKTRIGIQDHLSAR